MKNITTIDKLIVSIKKAEQSARRIIERAFSNMPDNPRIKRIDKRCYIIKFSDLTLYPGSNWDPEVHDFKFAANLIIERLSKCDLDSVGVILKQIVEKGTVVRNVGANYRSMYHVHPDIREFVNNRFFNGKLEMKTGLKLPGRRTEEIERKQQQSSSKV